MELTGTARILLALKEVLKSKNKTYADVAKSLGTSETTVKRIFSDRDAPLTRIEAMCAVAQVSLFDLLAKAGNAQEKTLVLSEELEATLAENPAAFFFWQILRERDVTRHPILDQVDEVTAYRLLRCLEKCGLIELLPENRIRHRVTGVLTLRSGGSLQKMVMERKHKELLDVLHTHLGEQHHFLTSSNRWLTPSHYEEMAEAFQSLARKYRDIAYQDETFSDTKDLRPASWLLALAPLRDDHEAHFTAALADSAVPHSRA